MALARSRLRRRSLSRTSPKVTMTTTRGSHTGTDYSNTPRTWATVDSGGRRWALSAWGTRLPRSRMVRVTLSACVASSSQRAMLMAELAQEHLSHRVATRGSRRRP